MASRSLQRYDLPLHAEDLDEFHVTRLLLLIKICGKGVRPTIEGRTKLAKLDFFVRYPRFLESAIKALHSSRPDIPAYEAAAEGVEASMVRYRYGPWDHRYYDLISLMVGRGCITVVPRANGTEAYRLTALGERIVDQLMPESAFGPIVLRCSLVSTVFGTMTGTSLKEFIYSTFEREIGALDLNTEIPSSTWEEKS